MKIRLITIALFLIALIGCENPPDQATSDSLSNITITAQFEQSGKKINKYLDKLYHPSTPQDVRIQILCIDYPIEYKTNYMPALLKLSPDKYTEAQLLANLDSALNYYKNIFDVTCLN